MRRPERFDPTLLTRADGLEAEILQEKAATLRRIADRLQEALAALREHDGSTERETSAARASLVRAASEALWYYVVQREASGLRDTDRVLDEMEVPEEVRLGMGVRERPYKPISCEIHDRLLELATLGREADLEIGTEEGHPERMSGVIEDVYSRQGAEYLRLRDGRTLRLDQLRRVDGRAVPPP